MSAKGYITPDQLAAYMGVTFSVAQEALADAVIASAEQWIDVETAHAWLEDGPITEDIYNPQEPYLWLKKAPIVSVTSVVASAPYCATLPLVENVNYFVQDLRDGRIYSPYTMRVYKVTVVYEPNADPVPAEVGMAALALAGSNMSMSTMMMNGINPGIIQRYVVGGELEVEFRKNLTGSGGTGGGGSTTVPQVVQDYLSRWIKGYVVV